MPPKLTDCGLGRGAQTAADDAARRPWRSLRSRCRGRSASALG